MEAYKVKYLNDHFFEVDTNDVIIPVNGQIYILLGEKETFEINKQKSEIGKSLNAKAKMAKLYKNEDEINWFDALHERYLTLKKIRATVSEVNPKEYIIKNDLVDIFNNIQ